MAELEEADLPEGDVTVEVAYSSLNYKDGLAVTGRGRIVRRPPLVCGIDLAGTVAESSSARWSPGDEVVLTGWGLSETQPGGYTTRQRVRSEWLIARPPGLTLAQTMAVGTAGLTSMLCVLALRDAGVDAGGEVVVTGAAGGVGSLAVALLAQLGYQVVASTGRPELSDYLRGLGAGEVVSREELSAPGGKPLEAARWAGGVDTVGSTTLARVIRQAAYGAAVAACGLAGGDDLPVSVLPFILRGVRLLGVDSVSCPTSRREEAWAHLAAELDPGLLDGVTTVEPLSAVPRLAEEILSGRVRGRVVVDVRG
ncbi:MAG: oxidoreductase [Actinomycetota bacterium]|nr:oxidoreductase [Actinomycetota bacterium]